MRQTTHIFNNICEKFAQRGYMAKIWASNEEFDFEALCEEKDIAALKHMLNADERALFIILITAFLG